MGVHNTIIAGLRAFDQMQQIHAGNLARAADPEAIRQTPLVSMDTTGSVRFDGARVEIDKDLLEVYRLLHADDQHKTTEANALEELLAIVTSLDDARDDMADLFAKAGITMDGVSKGTHTPQRFLSAIKEFTAEIGRVEDLIQDKRTAADSQIKEKVGRVNTILTELAKINELVGLTRNIAGENSDVANARIIRQAKLLSELRDYMNVSVIERDGTYTIQTESNSPAVLLDGRGAHPLGFTTSATKTTATTTYAGGQLSGITSELGVDITSSITTGEMKGLFSVRDDLMVKESGTLAEFTRKMAIQFNKVMNTGTANTPRSALTGAVTGLTNATAITIAGTIYITSVDRDGNYIGRHQLATGATTVGDLITAINGAGLANVAASLSADGRLQLTGNTGANVYVAVAGSGTVTDGTTTTNFSHFFGLQNLFTLTSGAFSDADVAQKLRINSSFLADAGALPIGALDTTVTTGGRMAVPKGDRTTATTLTLEFNDGATPTAFSAAGNLAGRTTTFKGYLVDFLATMTDTAQAAVSTQRNTHAAALSAEEANKNASGVDAERVLMEVPRLQFVIEALAGLFRSTMESQRHVLQMVTGG